MNYCKIHSTQMQQEFSKIKLDNNGQPKPYFAHWVEGKRCFGRPEKPAFKTASNPAPKANVDSMYQCNALNNAVSMVNAGTIQVSQLRETYRKLLSILTEKPEELDQWSGS